MLTVIATALGLLSNLCTPLWLPRCSLNELFRVGKVTGCQPALQIRVFAVQLAANHATTRQPTPVILLPQVFAYFSAPNTAMPSDSDAESFEVSCASNTVTHSSESMHRMRVSILNLYRLSGNIPQQFSI